MKMGYVEVCTNKSCSLFPSEETVRGHVYHFSEILQVALSSIFWEERSAKSVVFLFIHLHKRLYSLGFL